MKECLKFNKTLCWIFTVSAAFLFLCIGFSSLIIAGVKLDWQTLGTWFFGFATLMIGISMLAVSIALWRPNILVAQREKEDRLRSEKIILFDKRLKIYE